MRTILAAALVLTAAACAEPAEQAAAPPPPTIPASPPIQPAFVGKWAVQSDYCRQGYAWTFAEDGISTPGEVSCRWTAVTTTSDGGYVLPGECSSDEGIKPDEVRITMAGPDTLTVEARVWGRSTTLIRCPS